MNVQDGLSPKVVAGAITGVIVYLITKLGLRVDPVVEQAINVAAVLVAAWLAPPGAVKERPVGPASDDLLAPEVAARLKEPAA
jgi:hypothetical protein